MHWAAFDVYDRTKSVACVLGNWSVFTKSVACSVAVKTCIMTPY